MTKRCTNKGCQQDYEEADNSDDACQYHPGDAKFHEGYKIWTCCEKRFIDFTEFLNHPGCTRGRHTDVLPEKPEPAEPVKEEPPPEVRKPITQAPPRSMAPYVDLPVTVTQSLKAALERMKESQKAEAASAEIKLGQKCYNTGCDCEYAGPASLEEKCLHHPGGPVFHEGLKYWSCCPKKKTHVFEEFLSMPGCEEGLHCFIEKKKAVVTCRRDFFQTGTDVVVNFYAKNIERTVVKANANTLVVEIKFDQGNEFKADLHLGGSVRLKESSVKLMSTKMEIKLKKFEEGPWPDLEAAA